MDQFKGMASSPVWMTYRAVGSGTGEREIVGRAADGQVARRCSGHAVAVLRQTS